MGYNYNIGSEIENEIDSLWYDKYYRDPFSFYPKINVNEDSLDLLDNIKVDQSQPVFGLFKCCEC